MQLSETDLELLEMTTVPEQAMKILKNHFNKPLYQYFGYSDDELDYVPKDGICVDLGQKMHSGIYLRNKVNEINKAFKETGTDALAFASEYFIGLAEGNDCVAVIPGNDDFSILKAAGTEGFNYNIKTKQIIEKLTQWKKALSCDFRIIYADMQQVDAQFIVKPVSIRKLAMRINSFSPDTVDRIDGGLDEMIRIIESENIFTLFWD